MQWLDSLETKAAIVSGRNHPFSLEVHLLGTLFLYTGMSGNHQGQNLGGLDADEALL